MHAESSAIGHVDILLLAKASEGELDIRAV
jgi:hypothetical protein